MTVTERREADVVIACRSGMVTVRGLLSEPAGLWAVHGRINRVDPVELDERAYDLTLVAVGFRFPAFVCDRDDLLRFADILERELDLSALRRGESGEVIGVTDEMSAKAKLLLDDMEASFDDAD